jgi:hypothetical protein
MPTISSATETKKRKFCTGPSIVICIAVSSVRKTSSPNKLTVPSIMKKPALTLEMIIQKDSLRQISGGQNKARESQFWTWRNAAWFATSHDFQCPFLFLLFVVPSRSKMQRTIQAASSASSVHETGSDHLFTTNQVLFTYNNAGASFSHWSIKNKGSLRRRLLMVGDLPRATDCHKLSLSMQCALTR